MLADTSVYGRGLPSPPRTWTRRKGLASTGSSIFATRLEIASAATVQTLRNLSGTPAPPWLHKMWFPNAAGRSQSFSFPETRIQDETFDGDTISRPSPAFLASPRLGAQDCCASSVTTCIRESTCSRPVDGQELQIHPVPGFFRPGGFINRANHSNSLSSPTGTRRKPRPPAW